jgi:hypothetical protein
VRSGFGISVIQLAIAALVLLASPGCGGGSGSSTGSGGSTSAPPPAPQLAVSTLTAGGGQSMTAPKSLFTNYHVSGPGAAWVLTAGNVQMDFTAVPTVSWITISPTFGALPSGKNTGIGIITIDASSLPNTINRGGITVTAPGYQDNTVIVIELECGQTDSRGNPLCTLSLGSSIR